MKRAQSVHIIGIAGGSGSGKTYFARALLASLPPGSCALVFQDSYYFDQSARFDRDGGAINFDHPDSLDFPLLERHLAALKQGLPVKIPVYDFATHTRRREKVPQAPTRIVLVDGILIFHPERLRGLFDERVFFDAPEPLRYGRRLERDVRERGRTPEGVRAQFEAHVKPMHDRFVEPTQAFAHVVVRDEGDYQAALAGFVQRCRALLGGD